MPEAYIRARGVTKTYRSGASDLVVFENLDLDVERGEMLALVGESGAGKSTLLHLLGGLDSPSRGSIHYGSREITGLAPSEQSDFRNREIGFVWQIHYLLPEFTAQENVMMPLLIRGWGDGVFRACSLPAGGFCGGGKLDAAVVDRGVGARRGSPRINNGIITF